MRRILILSILLLLTTISKAQFYTTGDDPGAVKWNRTDTGTYKIIYPEGLDSLASVYASTLEKYRTAVGNSAGYVPGEYTWGKIPVVLHAFNANSNGSVAWAPRRMDLFTSPQSYGAEPMPWTDMLSIHEQRHVAQMQAGLSGAFRPFGWIFGEMFNGLVAGIYPSKAFLEGDAVIAETALSGSGRGRTGDFLNYYMIAFDNGDFRNWNRWRFGSQRYYAPDYYAAGYFLLSGIRYIYDAPDFTGMYFHHIACRPYDFNAFRNTLKRTAGKRPKEVFREIADTMDCIWSREIESRKPFTEYLLAVDIPSRYTEYSRNRVIGDMVYSVRSGMTAPATLVSVDPQGRSRRLRAFQAGDGKFSSWQKPGSDKGKIYWSELSPDKRWSHRVNSVIRYYDTESGRTRTLSKKGRLFNPSVSSDGSTLCVTEYTDDGRSRIVIMDSSDGKIKGYIQAPDSLQITESVLTGDRIFASGISDSGYGIYSAPYSTAGKGAAASTSDAEWIEVLKPEPVKILNLDSYKGHVTFTSDRTGVNEFYHLDPGSNTIVQKTSSRYGADDFAYSPDGDTLYCSIRQYEGHILAKIPSSRLLDRETDFSDIHIYPVADRLSEQEKIIARAGITESRRYTAGRQTSDKGIRRYRKGLNLFKIHSWAPVYFNVDRLKSFSYDHFYQMLSPGIAGVSQNELGTAIAQFGYSAHRNPYDRSRWKHSGHFSFSYSGWYPVIEASVDFNDRNSMKSVFNVHNIKGIPYGISTSSMITDKPYVTGKVSVYIPFDLSRGGWSSGIVPQLSYSISNDYVRTGFYVFNRGVPDAEDWLIAITQGETIPRQTVSLSLRAYTMRPVADSGVYPRWGVGFEYGAMSLPYLQQYYSPMAYAYLYSYFPGIIPQHGLHFTALSQAVINKEALFGTPAVNIIPQGLSSNSSLASIASQYSFRSLKLTLDYAMPLYIGDISILGPFMYLKRLILNPHIDFTMFDWNPDYSFRGNLFSAGASLTVDFERLFWLRFPFSVGVNYSYNGGTAFNSLAETLSKNGAPLGHHYVEPVFSVSF